MANDSFSQTLIIHWIWIFSGPATVSVSVDKMLGGTTNTAGKEVAITGQCLTGKFICFFHQYFEMILWTFYPLWMRVSIISSVLTFSFSIIDQFTIGNSPGGVGVLCGTLTNDHSKWYTALERKDFVHKTKTINSFLITIVMKVVKKDVIIYLARAEITEPPQ